LLGNCKRWKYVKVKSSNGSTRTSQLTQKAIACQILEFLNIMQAKKISKQIMSKMKYVEKKFKEAEYYLQNTCKGSIDEKMEITKM